MAWDQLLARIGIDPQVCGGKPCIRGHRIWVSLVLGWLAEGHSVDEVVAMYEGIEREDVLACLAYGAEVVTERSVDVPVAGAGGAAGTVAGGGTSALIGPTSASTRK